MGPRRFDQAVLYLEIDESKVLLHGVVYGPTHVGGGNDSVLREVGRCTNHKGHTKLKLKIEIGKATRTHQHLLCVQEVVTHFI